MSFPPKRHFGKITTSFTSFLDFCLRGNDVVVATALSRVYSSFVRQLSGYAFMKNLKEQPAAVPNTGEQ